MARRWRAFDVETINRELRTLPHEDFRRLTEAMLAYRLDEGRGYVIKNYGDGLMMVKDATQCQGRCLFSPSASSAARRSSPRCSSTRRKAKKLRRGFSTPLAGECAKRHEHPPYEPDFLDEAAEARAQYDPSIRQDWAAIKLMMALSGIREAQGLSHADVAARMNVSPAIVARLERRPWGAGFTRILAYAYAYAYAQALGVEAGIVGELSQAA